MTPPIEAAKARLTELEVRLPWTSVKKSWGPRREQWVSQVLAIVTSEALGAQLLSLEVRGVVCAATHLFTHPVRRRSARSNGAATLHAGR